MKVQNKNLVLFIIIAFVLLFGASLLLDIVLNGKMNIYGELFTSAVLAIPIGLVFNLVKNNWGKERRSTKESPEE